MRRLDVSELHYITLIDNVQSILNRGILSYELAAEVSHTSLAMPEIQARRTGRMKTKDARTKG
jgi:hypothetical protein